MFVLDGVRETKDGTNLLLGDVVDEQPEDHAKMRQAWNSGKASTEPESYDNEYGKTCAWYHPLFINGEKLGLIGTEVEIADFNRAIAANTARQIAAIAAILILTSAAALLIIHRRYITKISFLSQSVGRFAEERDPGIANEIRQKGTDELCVLSNQTSDMMPAPDRYMKNFTRTSDELSHTKKRADIESELARKDALTGIRNLKAIPHNSCASVCAASINIEAKVFVRLPKFNAGRLTPFKENLGDMTESWQADGVQRR